MGYFTDTEFDSTYDMIDAINEVVERHVRSRFQMVDATAVGLDPRCGRVFVNVEDSTIASCNQQGIEYYGGFEYIDSEERQRAGDYTFYTGSRVDDCIDALLCRETKESE